MGNVWFKVGIVKLGSIENKSNKKYFKENVKEKDKLKLKLQWIQCWKFSDAYWENCVGRI